MGKKPTQKDNMSEWNNDVEGQIDKLEQMKKWLSDREQEEYAWSWEDQVRLKRALCYVELAICETYCLQYHTGTEYRDWRRDEMKRKIKEKRLKR